MDVRGAKPRMKIPTEWSPSLAYAVGLITTDGCLQNDGRHIDFTSKDIQLIKQFQECLWLQRIKIGFKISGHSGKKCPRVQFGDINFYRWLVRIGLSPRKSRTLKAIRVPTEFFPDFIRGCFDGDGTIYSFWDKRWANSFMFYISFASGSKEFLLWLQNKINALTNASGHIAPGTRKTFQLKYAKKDSIALFNMMFYSDNLPHLKRKRLKALQIFREHGRVTSENKLARVVKQVNTPL